MRSGFPLRLLSHVNGRFFLIDPRQHPEVDHFEILSYTWGPQLDENHAWDCGIPGVDWGIRLHEHKIKDIKRLMVEANIRYLWVDSLCIKQNDKAEQNSEMGKMYQYYKNANRCHIMVEMKEAWHPQTIVDDLKFLDHILDHMRGSALASEAGLTTHLSQRLLEWKNEKTWSFFMDLPLVRSAAIEPGLLNCYSTCINHVRSLFDNQYFSRVWTFQEMILGKNISIWAMSPGNVSELGELSVWMDLATDAKDKAVKLKNWITRWRHLNTTTVDAILAAIGGDIASLTSLQIQVNGINSARTDIINGGPFWWCDNYKGVSNIFSAISIRPRACGHKPDLFKGLLGIFSGLFTDNELQTEFAGENLEQLSFAFFKQLSIRTGLAWTKLAMSSDDRDDWSWIPVVGNHEHVETTSCFSGVITLGLLKKKGKAATEAVTGLFGNPRKYMRIRLTQGNGDFRFIFKGCNCGKKLRTGGLFRSEVIPTYDQPVNIVQDETGRRLVQCATILGYTLDPGCNDILEYRQRFLRRLNPYWRYSDPSAKPLGWIDRCVSGTSWHKPGISSLRSHNMSMNYNMVDLYGCGSRLAQGSTATVMCEVMVNCGCFIYAPFALIFEALISVEGSSLGGISAALDDDGRIKFSDGLGLVQTGDIGRTFSLVAFGGEITAHKSYASSCRSTRRDQPVIAKLPWPTGRALVRDEFDHDVVNIMRDYGYMNTEGSGNLLLCRKHVIDSYKIIGVCVDGFIQSKNGPGLVKIR